LHKTLCSVTNRFWQMLREIRRSPSIVLEAAAGWHCCASPDALGPPRLITSVGQHTKMATEREMRDYCETRDVPS
jgi:hypothetical protein